MWYNISSQTMYYKVLAKTLDTRKKSQSIEIMYQCTIVHLVSTLVSS